MRQFNESEKALLRHLALLSPEETTSISRWLGTLYFTERKGRALIFQETGNYAMFYLRPEVFDQEQPKRLEVIRLLELATLIQYLREQRYIFIYAHEKPKVKPVLFVHDSFDTPKINGKSIELNIKGDYTTSPEAILSKDGKVIYKGVRFEGDTCAMMMSSFTGLLYVSAEARRLVKNQFNTLDDQTERRQQKIILAAGIAAFLMICAMALLAFQNHRMKADLEAKLETLSEHVPASDGKGGPREWDHLKTSHETADPVANVYGIDVSKYNGNIVDEIERLDSLTFIICKATEGVSLTDPDFAHNWEMIRQKGLIRGAYHFYHIDDDPLRQADHFLSVLGELDSTDIAPVIDVEPQSIPEGATIDIAKLQSDLFIFLSRVEEKTQRRPMIYTPVDFANEYLRHDEFSKYPLWLAEYISSATPVVPFTWQKEGYTIWQRSDHYSIHSQPSDFDYFHGRRSVLYR